MIKIFEQVKKRTKHFYALGVLHPKLKIHHIVLNVVKITELQTLIDKQCLCSDRDTDTSKFICGGFKFPHICDVIQSLITFIDHFCSIMHMIM